MTVRRHGSVLGAALGLALVGSLVALGAAMSRGNDAPAVEQLSLPAPVPAAARGVATTTAATGIAPAPAWVVHSSARTGVPTPAVRAYARASLVLATEQPGCHLGWTTLAGIGWVESQHGSFAGRALREDGTASAPVSGPELDGSGDVAAIGEAGAWVRAEGPMQFLPSTWKRWAADGDQDGVADVGDLDDAALAAGRYLCADGHDLSTGAGWTAAVWSYNHAQTYVDAVRAAANTYNERLG